MLDLTGLHGGERDGSARVTLRHPARATAAAGIRTLDVGDVYGPGCARDSRIGRLVWAALRSQPLVIEESAGEWLRPLHVSDLADALSAMARTPPPEGALPATALADGARCTVAEMAAAVRKAVRPVPVVGGAPPAAAPRPSAGPPPPDRRVPTDLVYGLHTYAQWLAYEGIRLASDV